MNRVVTRMGFTTLALVAGSVAFAQTVTTGGVTGVVKDDKGAPIAGATVSLTSGQGSRTATTGADGSYRLGLLNPGDYQVSVSKDGFTTFKNRVSVQVNQMATVNVGMASASAAEKTVVVTATSANVDFTANTTGYTTSVDNLSSVPKARDFNDLAFLAPGTVTSGQLGGISIAGASSLENSFFVDGVSTNDFRKGFQGAAMPTDFVDQVEIQTGGFKPEYSALGGVFNVITKSGTNDFAGSAWFNYDANSLAAAPKSNIGYNQVQTPGGQPQPGSILLFVLNQAPPNDRYDVGFSAGGAIIKDKLFYFVGGNQITTKVPDSANLPNANGLKNGQDKTTDVNVYGKINWQAAPNHNLTFTTNIRRYKRDNPVVYPAIGTATWGFSQKSDQTTLGANYDWTITPSLFLSVKVAKTEYKDTVTPTDSVNERKTNRVVGVAAGFTNATNYETGGFGLNEDLNKSTTTQFKADLSYFLGTHNLKFGMSETTPDYTLVDRASGGLSTPYLNTTGTLASYQSGRRSVVRATAGGAFNGVDLTWNANNSKVKAKYDAFYAQDTWEVFSGFRLAYGFRFETQEVKDNFGRKALKFDNFQDLIQPRLGITWDLNNDGRTKLSANYGRYFLEVPMQPVMRTGGTEVFIRNRFSTASSTYNVGTGAYTITGLPFSVTDFSLFFSAPPIVDGTKLTQRDEYILGIDHQLESGWTIGLKAKHRELKNPIEDSVLTDYAGNGADPAGYSVLWNPHPGVVTWTAGALSATPGAKITADTTHNLFPTAFNTYDSVEFTVEKKTSAYYVSLNYTWSRLFGNYEGVGQSSNGQADALITSTFDYWSYVGKGLLPIDRTHVLKAFGSYTMDIAGNPFTSGFKVVYQSGTPRSLLDDGSYTQGLPSGSGSSLDVGGYGNAVPANFQYGNFGRTPTTLQTDLSFEYGIKAGKVKISPNINIFNVFNSRSATSQSNYATDGNGTAVATWGQENGWLRGRNFRWGVKVNF